MPTTFAVATAAVVVVIATAAATVAVVVTVTIAPSLLPLPTSKLSLQPLSPPTLGRSVADAAAAG